MNFTYNKKLSPPPDEYPNDILIQNGDENLIRALVRGEGVDFPKNKNSPLPLMRTQMRFSSLFLSLLYIHAKFECDSIEEIKITKCSEAGYGVQA